MKLPLGRRKGNAGEEGYGQDARGNVLISQRGEGRRSNCPGIKDLRKMKTENIVWC